MNPRLLPSPLHLALKVPAPFALCQTVEEKKILGQGKTVTAAPGRFSLHLMTLPKFGGRKKGKLFRSVSSFFRSPDESKKRVKFFPFPSILR